jgi:rhodanese-related sulfurtransferase
VAIPSHRNQIATRAASPGCAETLAIIVVSGYYSLHAAPPLENPPMPTAQVTAPEPSIDADSPHLELLISPAPPAAVPAAQVVTPAAPTARIHWIGTFVDRRHPADLYAEIVAGASNLVVVDARWPEAYAREHLPTAINLPPRHLDEKTTAGLSRQALYVVYCWNESCRASTKTAQRLEALGFKAKELHGGLETWRKQGFPTERT